MESSINFYHNKNLIETISDEKLFVKNNVSTPSEPVYKWVQIPNTLYKIEGGIPTNDLGISGDYCATYYRRYNYLKYSETFTAKTTNNTWSSYNCIFSETSKLPMPYTNGKKICGLNTVNKHYIDYRFINELKTYTFSIYVKPAELYSMLIGLYSDDYSYGVGLRFSIIDGVTHQKIEYVNDNQEHIYNVNTYVEEIDVKEKLYRIGITAKLDNTAYLKARFKLLKTNMNEEITYFDEFKMENYQEGLYINSAQLTKTNTLDDYIKTYGYIKSSLTLDKIYKKNGSSWSVYNKNLYYIPDNYEIIDKSNGQNIENVYLETKEEIGNDGDIAVLSPIISLNPFIKLGNDSNSKTIEDKMDNPIGYLYYNTNDGHYYIKTKKSTNIITVSEDPLITQISYSDCRLMYDDQKPDNNAIVHAILLNQQSYQHYTRCSHFGRGASHRFGFNASGHGSFYGNVIQRNKGY